MLGCEGLIVWLRFNMYKHDKLIVFAVYRSEFN
ncbi:hypothetical protein PSEHALCIP103_02118 [Pseudoalteromonas haloplanktis]|uniref:Uncharacterized protein n=1 Tax=Pseudoalteromonas haloplanktis TaxID=228 RepID=A0A9W4VRM0_PSEHA|nr:hypothetical protein PSEHALCIP103_02118 [Pseudoalteromonas haloplanktis]